MSRYVNIEGLVAKPCLLESDEMLYSQLLLKKIPINVSVRRGVLQGVHLMKLDILIEENEDTTWVMQNTLKGYSVRL
jgi:hypothetical protein